MNDSCEYGNLTLDGSCICNLNYYKDDCSLFVPDAVFYPNQNNNTITTIPIKMNSKYYLSIPPFHHLD